VETSTGSNPSSVEVHEECDALKHRNDELTARLAGIAELLKCTPAKIEHDIRNLQNELQLLRTVFQQQESQQ
jgi:hypothetical protein